MAELVEVIGRSEGREKEGSDNLDIGGGKLISINSVLDPRAHCMQAVYVSVQCHSWSGYTLLSVEQANN